MQRFLDVTDGQVGLSFISPGLREYEVTQDRLRAIAVTLLRAYEVNLTTVSKRWDPHPEMVLSQCPGAHEFRWVLYPHEGDACSGGTLDVAEALVSPLQPCQSGSNPEGDLPECHGLLEVEGAPLALSALKPAEDGNGWILRLYNPSGRPVRGAIRFGFPVGRVVPCTLEEVDSGDPLALTGGGTRVELEAGTKKIVTLRVVPADRA